MFRWDWLTGWVTGTLEYLVPFFFKKKARVLFLGLDDAGKSTLLFRLKTGRMTQTSPSLYPNSEEINICNVSFTAFDLGGHLVARRIWRNYYEGGMDAIVFIIDGSCKERFEEAKEELNGVLNDETISNIPVAVLINKIDLASCVGEAEIIYKFDLFDKVTGREGVHRGNQDKKKRPLEVFPVSILQNQGYGQAFKWIAEKV